MFTSVTAVGRCRPGVLAAALVAATVFAGAPVTAAPPDSAADVAAHRRNVEEWRQTRHKRLLSDQGWLTVAGLFWLKEGANAFGSGKDNPVLLPAHSAPAKAGILRLARGKVTVEVAPGVNVTLAGAATDAGVGQAVSKRELRSDLPGPPDLLALGDLRFFVIDRDGRVGIRLRDLKDPRRQSFKGIDSFPITAAFRVTAKLVPHPTPKTMQVPSVLGGTTPLQSPGTLHFTLAGQALTLDAVLEEPADKQLWVIFRDLTTGKETYGAGRYVYTDSLPDKDGKLVLDFNKAYNPPCALTPYATCPLPPRQNRLPVRIEAGEKRIPGH
jgi:uncharacterized protein (DUF1684 family)